MVLFEICAMTLMLIVQFQKREQVLLLYLSSPNYVYASPGLPMYI